MRSIRRGVPGARWLLLLGGVLVLAACSSPGGGGNDGGGGGNDAGTDGGPPDAGPSNGPTITALTPCGTVANGQALTVTVTGTKLVQGLTATFGGQAVSATFVSDTQATIDIPGSMLTSAPTSLLEAVVVTNPADGGGDSNAFDLGVATAVSTLAGDVQPIFTTSCATPACHVPNAPLAPMALTDGTSYANLVGVTSTGCPSKLRVKACRPTRAESYLVDKILATQQDLPCVGLPMPRSGSLAAADKQKILDWVAQGAPQ